MTPEEHRESIEEFRSQRAEFRLVREACAAERQATRERMRVWRLEAQRKLERRRRASPLDDDLPDRLAVWTISGAKREVRIWFLEHWNRLPAAARPSGALYIGGVGWVVVGPAVES